jgi:ribosomal protein S12 methylthiotransferase
MNRKGTRQSYLDLFKKLREEIPDICIRSTFIAGFPTETEEEHENMKAFLKEADLDNCGFFAYSKEPDTPAAKLKGQILQSVKNKRVKALYKTQAEVSAKKLKKMRGQTISVVCDGIDYERECFVGRSYKNAPEIDGKVYFHAMEAMQGKEYEIKIIQTDSYDLYGCTKEYEDETSN